jgi:hypothetical protein
MPRVEIHVIGYANSGRNTIANLIAHVFDEYDGIKDHIEIKNIEDLQKNFIKLCEDKESEIILKEIKLPREGK